MKKTINLASYISSRLKYIRKSRGLSQEQLSLKAGLDPRYVNKLENLNANARLDTLEHLLEALNITYSEFFQFDIEINKQGLEEIFEIIASLPEQEQKEKIEAIKILLRK